MVLTVFAVTSVGTTVQIGRKWWAHEAVDQAEARLRHSILVGSVAIRQAGTGRVTRLCYDKAKGRERETSADPR